MVEIEAKGAIDVGSIIGGRFKILSCIGKGGMGIVYKAMDLHSDKLVAVKVLFPERVPDAQSIARFQQEVRAASLLDHPCLAKVCDSGIAESGQPYLVMDLIEGTTLAAKLAQTAQLPVDETLKIFILVCDGLAHAHDHHILHRDLKPSNIMLTTGSDGSLGVKILDFGLAKFREPSGQQSLHITHTGELVGSPLYMSPEQARGTAIDERSDLYSLGCTLYEALTGGPPHIGQNPVSTLLKRETDRPLPLSEGSLGRSFSQRVEQIVDRLLNLDPMQRYQSAHEVKVDLLKILNSNTYNAVPAAVIKPPPEIPAQSKGDSNRQILPILAVSVATISVIGLLFFWFSFHEQRSKTPGLAETKMPVEKVEMPRFVLNAQTQLGKGSLLRETGQFEQSIQVFKDTIALYRAKFGPKSEEEAAVYLELAITYMNFNFHKPNEAYDALKTALGMSDKLASEDNTRLANLMQDLAAFYSREFEGRKISTPDRAIELYQHAASLYQRPSIAKKVEAGKCYLEKGKDLALLGQYTQAEESLNTALALFNEKNVSANYKAHALAWLAHCCHYQQRFSDARNYDTQALALLENKDTPPDKKLVCGILNSLALDDISLSKDTANKKLLTTAETLYERSLRFSQDDAENLRDERIDATQGLGDIYLKFNRSHVPGAYEKARQYYETALAMCQADPKLPYKDIGTVYQKWGILEGYEGHQAKELQYLQMALKFPASRSKKFTLEQVHLATVHRKQGHPDWAEAICTQLISPTEHRFGHDSVECADVCAELGQNYLAQNKKDKARAYLERAQAVYRKVLGSTDPKTSLMTKLLANLK